MSDDIQEPAFLDLPRAPAPGTAPVSARPAVDNTAGALTNTSEPPQTPVMLYDIMTGRVLNNMALASHDVAFYLDMNIPLLFNRQGDAATHYVSHGELLERPASPATLAGMTITGIPTDAQDAVTLTISQGATKQTYPIDPGTTEVELDFPHAGAYTLELDAFPYQPFLAMVTV